MGLTGGWGRGKGRGRFLIQFGGQGIPLHGETTGRAERERDSVPIAGKSTVEIRSSKSVACLRDAQEMSWTRVPSGAELRISAKQNGQLPLRFK